MKKILLSFLCCMLAVIGMQAAETYSYTFTKTQFSANGTKTLNNVDWALAGDGDYWGYDGTKGQQLGSSKKPYTSLTLSTNAIPGTIKKIVINTSGGSSVKASFTVSVGGTQYGNSTTLTATATSYTFEGSASGEIKFSYTQTSSKALYIKSISVTYEEGGDTPEEVKLDFPTFNPESTQFEGVQTVEILHDDKECEIYYSMDGEEGSYQRYTEAITVRKTTTIWAYAKKDDIESIKAFATYTAFVEAPTLSTPDDVRTFEESLTVTINVNEEKGLKAFYSTDGVNYTEYTGPFTITEKTTVYAKAKDANDNESAVVEATYTKIAPTPTGKQVVATISFASTAQRVSQDGNSQVWRNDGITFTNNKSASQNAVVSNVNPVRLYAGSEIIVECSLGTITEIKFEANAEKSSYASALKNSIGNAATLLGSTVTVSGINASTFTIAKLTAQVRLNSMTVTYVVDADAVDVPEPTFSVTTGEEVEQGQKVAISVEGEYDIFYSTNGDVEANYSPYTDAIEINETTTIYAYAQDAEGNKSDVVSAQYTVFIPVEGTWTLVTDANTLCNGDEVVIVAKDYDVALSTDAGNNRDQAAVKKEGNDVKFAQDVQVITLGEVGEVNGVRTWSMHTAEGYLYSPGTSNGLKTTDDDKKAAWSIAIGDEATGYAAGMIDMNNDATEPANVMRYNQSSSLFSCYKANNSQQDIVIYRNTPETLVYNVTVPAGTPACNIVGDFNGWTAFVPMTKVDDTHYTITIDNVTKSKKYKYTCGDDLKFVEMQADGVTDVVDRTWNENDVVEAWNAVPDFAETITARDYYFEPTVWATDEAWYAVYLYNRNIEENNYQWVQGYVTKKGLVVFTYGGTKKYTHMIFCRMNPASLDEKFVGDMKWENVWDQTNEETFDPNLGDWACFAITSMGQNGANSTGVWGVVQEPTAVDGVEATNGIAYANGIVAAEGAIEVYNVNGMVVARGNESLDLRNLNAGVYIVRNGNNVRKVVR